MKKKNKNKQKKSNSALSKGKIVKKVAFIDKNQCDKFAFCPVKRVCPVNAITQHKFSFFRADTPVIDAELCVGCGKCVPACVHGAVKMKTVKIKKESLNSEGIS